MSTEPARTLVRRIRRRPRMLQSGMRVAAALLLAAPVAAQQPGGTITASAPVINRAAATYASPWGGTSVSEDSAAFTVSFTVGVQLSAGTAATIRPGGQATFAHTLTNAGQRTDRITLATTLPVGWSATIHLAPAGALSGVRAAGTGTAALSDSAITSVTLDPGGTQQILVRVTAAADAADSSTAAVRLTAQSAHAAEASATAEDRLTVEGPRAVLELTKLASRAEAAHGDTVGFTLAARNAGDAASDSIVVADTLPLALRYVPGTLARDGASLPDSLARPIADGRTAILIPGAPLDPGEGTAVSFQTRVATGASRDSLTNRATVTGRDGASGAASVRLGAVVAGLALEKSIVGDTLVPLGGQLTYRLRVQNTSAGVSAFDVVLTDSLPDELRFVSGEDDPAVTGQVVRWTIPTLGPGEAVTRDIVVRVVRMPAAGDLVNHAAVGAVNANAALVTAARTVVQRAAGAALAITKQASVLEVGLGEAVPYVVTVHNRSLVPLSNLVVHDVLPDGMRLAGNAVPGADSITVSGRDVRMYFSGPLAPDARHAFRYNGVLTTARSRTIANLASASADGGRVVSDTAVTLVRVRRGFEVENRTLVGKVYLDRNDDGRQDAGEPGVAGVDILMADGATVRTDAEGRYSFRDIRAGRHALRLDMARVPRGMRLPGAATGVQTVRADAWTLPTIDFRLVPDSGTAPCTCPDTAPRRHAANVVQQGGAAAGGSADRATAGGGVPDELLRGPAIRFIAPDDDVVVHAGRIYVGARGEPNRAIRLHDGDSLIADAVLRPDGIHDFIGVPLAPGPHVLRLWTRNSWGIERWDTVHVHRSGAPAGFSLDEAAPVLHPDQRTDAPVRMRVLDAWGMPVAPGTQVTLEATGATVEGEDTDRASLGLQRPVLDGGWVTFSMRGGPVTGPATVSARSGAARGSVTMPVLPVLRSTMVMGTAEVGLGATAPSFGAVTARGTLGDRTAITVSYDSRRRSDENEAFGRAVDPMDANQYPTLGDGSTQTSSGTGSGALAARIERDYDWVELGDITPRNLAGSGRLFSYRRALTGVQGRSSIGGMTVTGFGSVTSQHVQERQLPAVNGSGPYLLGGSMRPGTERITIEVRARENAARILDRRELAHITDYELDYASGTLLLRRPLSSMDAAGNPVYIVAYVERTSGGDARFVGGGRVAAGMGPALMRGLLDSAAVAVSVIHDATGGATSALVPGGAPRALDIIGTDLRIERKGVVLEGEVLRSALADTSAMAARAQLGWRSRDDRWSAGAEWTRVAPGFGGGMDPRLASGFRELRFNAGVRLSEHEQFQLVHEQQYFETYGIDRQHTSLRAEQRLGARALSQELGLVRDGSRGAVAGDGSLRGRGRIELALDDAASVWLEASRAFATGGASGQPDRFGAGAGYRLFGKTRLEATHFLNRAPGGMDYGTSAVNLRTETPLGGRAWGGIERASAARASHAALLGIEQRVRIARGWELQSSYERRMGLDAAPLSDPARSLPFAQLEADRSLATLGMSFLPGADRARLTIRGERQDGSDQHGFRLAMAGDVPLGPDAALLARSDWAQYERTIGTLTNSRQDRSLLGYALRPTRSDRFNMLAKLEWRRSLNPLGTAALTDSAESRRMIATSDAIWNPLSATEIAARYAVRWADWRYAGLASATAPIAHYGGLRAERAIGGRWGARLDGRYLHEQTSGIGTWALAPSLTYRLTTELQFEVGYRAGTLQDLDFGAANSRAFATLGFHFTERTLAGPAAFWRERLGSDR